MIIKLFKVSESRNTIGKVLNNPKEFEVTFRSDFDITNPEIKLEFQKSETPLEYNYIEIPELNRKYFIDEISNVNNRVWQYNCSCDVLETYKSEILNSECSYKKEIAVGDYGELELSKTGKEKIEHFKSSVEMARGDNTIFSVMV